MTKYQINAKGLKCPMPVIRLQQQARLSQVGDQIEIDCTDPGAEKDLQSWCKVNKHQYLGAEAIDAFTRYRIKIGAKNQPTH
jgi:tRNA 2-thiouridine synthesizing protein A